MSGGKNKSFLYFVAVHLIIIFVNNQLDVQFFFLYLFFPILYMFRATKCPSWGESIISIRPLVYVTLCRWHVVCRFTWNRFHLNGHLRRVTYNWGRIDTVDSSDDEHLVARNMERIGIIKNCASSWFLQTSLIFCLFLARQPPMGHGLLIHEVSGSHTTTYHSR